MPVTSHSPDYQFLVGHIVLENFEGDGQIAVNEAIGSEVAPFFSASTNIAAVASWGLSVKIMSYDISAVKSITGFPPRSQFGCITYNSIATFFAPQYIQYVRQAFAPQRCIVYPLGYVDVPFTTADISPFIETGATDVATGYTARPGLVLPYATFSGGTGFHYDLCISAVANMTISYVVWYNVLPLFPPERPFLIVNF